MNGIFTNKTVNEALKKYDCTLGLDISKSSTGVALYQNGVLRLYRISLVTKCKDNPLWETELKKEFRNDLIKIVKGKEFDLVVIENTINGCNALTNKILILLNSVFDDMVTEGICKVNKTNLIRPFANVWRKELKGIAGNTSATNTKVLVEKLLHRLGYSFVLEHITDSANDKKKIGYSDICDATGMLIAYMYKKSSLNTKS